MMKRLLIQNKGHIEFAKCEHSCNKCALENCVECETHRECFNLLYEYQETGITPDEIKALQEQIKTLQTMVALS